MYTCGRCSERATHEADSYLLQDPGANIGKAAGPVCDWVVSFLEVLRAYQSRSVEVVQISDEESVLIITRIIPQIV